MGPPSVGLLCCALLFAAAAVTGSPQKPGVVDEGIVILPVDPCQLPLDRHTGGAKGEGFDRDNLQALGQGCPSRTKRAAPWNPPTPQGHPNVRDARGIFKTAPNAQKSLRYPGTKWCGPGDTARNYWDLGRLADEDRCCRMHDYCPENIPAGECSHGICNKSLFTRSHCVCDESFRQCLQALKSPAADSIGAIYFNLGNIICFAEDEEDNDLSGNMGETDILEDRLGSDSEQPGLWPNARENLDTLGQRQRIGCSGRPNCRYKFLFQRRYTEAANRDNAIPTSVQRPGMHQLALKSQQLDSMMHKRSGINEVDQQTVEILSKFFRNVLRSTGLLGPRN